MTNLKLFKEKILQTQKSNDIQKALYETYKTYWMRNHISIDQIIKTINEFQQSRFDDEYENLEDFIADNGYDGQLYASFNEFLNNEYLDTDYMLSLIENDTVREAYLEDVKDGKIEKAVHTKCDKLLEMLSHYQKEKENEQLTERYEEALLELNNSIELKKFFAIIEYAMDNKILFHEIIKYLLEDDIYVIVRYEVDLIKEDGKLILQVYNNNGAKIYICYENNDLVITATEDKKSDVISLLENFYDVISIFLDELLLSASLFINE